jgi:hypothetical protein
MTFEEIQKTIEGMLAVQKDLQAGQLRIQESQAAITDNQTRIQSSQEADREQIEQMMAVSRELQERQIEQMMAVSRELQERQIQLLDTQERERETIGIMVSEMTRLIEVSNRHERRIEQLIGYSITNEGEHLDIEERFRALESRLQRLESTN